MWGSVFAILILLTCIVSEQALPLAANAQGVTPHSTPLPNQGGLAVFQGLNAGGITSVAFTPGDPMRIYAGGGHGLFRSADGGQSWQLLSAEPVFPRVLLVHPKDPQVLFACRQALAGEKGLGAPGVFKSTDGGISWHREEVGVGQADIFSLALDPNDPRTVYAGGRNGQVFKSTR